jgi:hypothetical protein
MVNFGTHNQQTFLETKSRPALIFLDVIVFEDKTNGCFFFRLFLKKDHNAR